MTDGWIEFASTFAAFMASHAIPARPALRKCIVAVLGERVYIALYSAVSVAIIVWLFGAAARAPDVPVWDDAGWQAWVPNVFMPLACLLLSHGVGAPNPLSFGGAGNHRFDAERPGIVGVTQHPLLWAVALWAGGTLFQRSNSRMSNPS